MFVGLDVHKESIDVATADEGRTAEVRHYGKITGDLAALDKVLRKLHSTGRTLHVVYEATQRHRVEGATTLVWSLQTTGQHG